MQITWTTSTKYYLLSVLGALMVTVGVLAVAPSARAQVALEPPSIDKECTPNPVQVGGTIACTIDVEAAPGTSAIVQVTDMLPAGLTVTEATFQASGGVISGQCTVADNTVTCPDPRVLVFAPVEVTIEATAQQCGTFRNTATATGFVVPAGGGSGFPFDSIQDTEEITVVGCEEAGGGGAGGGGAGGATPITQEGEQESEAGEIDQSFDVS